MSQPAPAYPIAPLSRLTSFCIGSSILLQRPLVQWMINTIQRSSKTLTSISFRYPGLDGDGWGALLSRISLPVLSRLEIFFGSARYADLMDFLSRHQNLGHLLIHSPYLTGVLRPFPPNLPIPSAIKNHPQQNPRLEELSDSNKGAFIAPTDITSSEPPMMIQLKIFIDPGSPLLSMSNFNNPKFSSARRLHVVRSLVLRSEKGPYDAGKLTDLAKWLASFPALIELECAGLFPAAMATEGKQLEFINVVIKSCPQLQYIMIGRDRRSVEQWKNVSG